MSLLSSIVRFSICLSLAMPFAQAEELSSIRKEQLKGELEYVGQMFATQYAPKEWKEKFLNWNLPAAIATSKSLIDQATSLRQARMAVVEFLNTTADYHVGYSFISTERAGLPFQVRTVEGKTILVFIDRTKLSNIAFPFVEGDEILTMNGRPVAAVLADIKKFLGSNVELTDAAMADLYLVRRSGAANSTVDQGPVTLTIKRAANEKVGSVQLTWEYTPEELATGIFSTPFALKREPIVPDLKMISPKALEMAEATNRYGLGGRESFLPNFGDRIWETAADNTFDAYMYQSEEGFIGVIRLPSYIPGYAMANLEMSNYTKAVADFAGILKHFQKFTRALIIDQNNNPGGSVFYLYALASMLSDQALTVPQHRVALSFAEANSWIGSIKELAALKTDEDAKKVFGNEGLAGYPVSLALAHSILDYARFYVNEFRTGKDISSPYYLYGVDKINPSPYVQYTKPVVLLTNELDFSGGDFFPAILQDNKRVTVVGTRTAGAGGYVKSSFFPNSFGLASVSFTGSIAERVDKNPIENLGVTPDVLLPMTLEDYRGGFVKYQTGVKAVVKDLLK